MPIEIQELIIKTTVDSKESPTNKATESIDELSISRLKKQLLAACKTYINEKVNEEKER